MKGRTGTLRKIQSQYRSSQLKAVSHTAEEKENNRAAAAALPSEIPALSVIAMLISYQSISIFLMITARMLSCFSHVWFLATLWTVAHQGPLSMGSSRQEYWSGLPCPPQGIFPTQGWNPRLLQLLHCRRILYPWATGEAPLMILIIIKSMELCPNTLREKAILSMSFQRVNTIDCYRY